MFNGTLTFVELVVDADNLSQRRRDPRYRVPAGSGTIEFPGARRSGERVVGSVIEISAVGVVFELDRGETSIRSGELLGAATLRFGP